MTLTPVMRRRHLRALNEHLVSINHVGEELLRLIVALANRAPSPIHPDPAPPKLGTLAKHPVWESRPREGRIFEKLASEACEALDRIVRGADPRQLVASLNRSRAIGSRLHVHQRKGIPPWRVSLGPPPVRTWRDAVLSGIAQALISAERIARCDACGYFFVRGRHRRQRFCSEECSTTFHNERRQKSGYFRKQRRRRMGERLGHALPVPGKRMRPHRRRAP